MEPSDRIKKIPPYLFAEISKKIAAAKAAGIDVISLGIGDPDMPTPQPIIDSLKKAVMDSKTHQYPDYEGSTEFREAVAKWYKRQHNVDLDYKTEVLALIGSKEGGIHLAQAYVNPGDYCLIPDPGYPTYRTSTIFSGGIPYAVPCTEESKWLPILSKVPADILKKSKILFLNYPNNPTGAVATKEFLTETVAFCKKHDIILCMDNPYSECTFEGFKALSLFEIPGAMDIGVEFNSLSKPYNMTGWRIGMAVGNKEIIKQMGTIKNNVDSGVFTAIQKAGITALELPQSVIDKQNAVYSKRFDMVIEALNSVGIKCKKPKATFYLWFKVPKEHTSASYATLLLEKAGIVITPGAAYGINGEGYCRISVTLDDKRLKEAMDRIKKL